MIIRDMQSTGGNAERERYTLMSGFSVKRLTEKDMKWAPAGRDHKLECMGGAQFNVVKVRDSGGPLQLAQALPQPRGRLSERHAASSQARCGPRHHSHKCARLLGQGMAQPVRLRFQS